MDIIKLNYVLYSMMFANMCCVLVVNKEFNHFSLFGEEGGGGDSEFGLFRGASKVSRGQFLQF